MRILTVGLLVAAGLALAVPANAEGVYVGAGPNGVGVGVHSDRDRDWHHHYARDREVVVRGGREHCRVTVIHEHGMTKRIKRCD